MTLIRPASTSIVARAFDSVTLKTALAAILSVSAWHYTDAGDIKTLRQQNADQEHRLDMQREAIGKKVNEADYDRDVRGMAETLNRIQVSIDGIHHTLEERH